MNKEIWKDVKGYEGYYKVSNYGNVKSVDRVIKSKSPRHNNGLIKRKGAVMKQRLSHKGYPTVYLSKNNSQKTVVVHRLVAKAFIPNPENKPQVNHKDTDKENNNVNNLEWSTNIENMRHAVKSGVFDDRVGEKSPRAILKKNEVLKIRKLYNETDMTQHEIGHMFGVTNFTVSDIITGKTWTHI